VYLHVVVATVVVGVVVASAVVAVAFCIFVHKNSLLINAKSHVKAAKALTFNDMDQRVAIGSSGSQ